MSNIWEMSDLLLGYPDHRLTYHSIIGDMTFLYCTDMGWSSFILLSHCFILYPITSFQICLTPFIHFLILTHFWFDTFYTSFTRFIDSLNTYPFFLFHHRQILGYLGSMAHEFFYTCLILYTRAWIFYYWVFVPSFPSFLLPYHPSVRYVPCFKTTLRLRDHMSSSTASTWTGVWDLVDV